MSRYRLYPTAEQERQMLLYCSHARYVWNLALEQMNFGTPGRRAPGFNEQFRQLTQARNEHPWLRDVPTVVGNQALRDFHQACLKWWRGTHGRPTWRARRSHEGFRVTGDQGPVQVARLNRRWSQVRVPRIGWVRFRRTRATAEARSFRITRDSAGRWHVAFAVKPDPIAGPGAGVVIGVDRGIAVTFAYSDGTMLRAPRPKAIKRAEQALSRCDRGSNRRAAARVRLARAHRRNADRRRDFVEKATTDLARRADLIRVEDLRVAKMTRSGRGSVEQPGYGARAKARLNRSILTSGWGLFVERLQDKASGRVETINAAYTSQTCAACGLVDARNRESQAFRCVGCGHRDHADVNAARVIAAGRAARGAEKSSATKRRPQRNDLLVV